MRVALAGLRSEFLVPGVAGILLALALFGGIAILGTGGFSTQPSDEIQFDAPQDALRQAAPAPEKVVEQVEREAGIPVPAPGLVERAPAQAVADHPAGEQLRQTIEAYFLDLEAKDIPKVLGYYINSRETFAQWTGKAGVFAGEYRGFGNIRVLYATVIGNTEALEVTVNNYQASFLGDEGTITMQLVNTGKGKLIGKFTMNIDVTQVWKYDGSQWKIADDRWNFALFDTEIVAQGTVFPLHWKKVGDYSMLDKRLSKLLIP